MPEQNGKMDLPKGIEVNSPALSSSLHVIDVVPKPGWLHTWEHYRPLWLQEIAGEFIGVFLYCFAGFGATAAMNFGLANNFPAQGNLFQIGFAYGIGIVFAISMCAMSSGGHFNPAVTVSFAVWRGFPWNKVPHFILAQISGAFTATFIVYAQYRPYILAVDAALRREGKAAQIFSPSGPAGIFSIYANAGVPLKWVFVNEFFADIFLGIVIWGALDPSNIFVSTTTAPVVIGFAYSVVVWGYAPATVATNCARDLGARLATIALWGTEAWGGNYAAISALVSFLSTLLAALIYELLLSDTSRVVTMAHRELITNMDRHREHKAYRYNLHAEHLRNRGNSFAFTSPIKPEKEGSENEKV